MAIITSSSISQNSQNIASNTTNSTAYFDYSWTYGSHNLAWLTTTLYFNGGGYSRSNQLNPNQTASGSANFATLTLDIGHNADGTKTTNMSGALDTDVSSGVVYWSASKTFATIARASQPSMSNFNIEDKVTINTNRLSTNFTHTIKVKFGTFTKTLATGITDRYIWDTVNDKDNLYSQIPNSLNGKGTVTVDTYSGTILIGTKTVEFTANVSNSNPTFTDFEYVDMNPVTTELTGDNKTIVKYYSDLRIIISALNNAVAKNGATIKKYRVNLAGRQNEGDYNSDGVEIPIYPDGGAILVSAIDSRGLQTTVTKTFSMVDYFSITGSNFTVEREDGVGSKVLFELESTYWNNNFGAVQNEIQSIEYRHKKRTETKYDDEWIRLDSKCEILDGIITNKTNGSNFFSTTGNGNTAVEFEATEYDFEIRITDKLQSNILRATVNSGILCTAKRKNEDGTYSIGINKFPRDGDNIATDAGGEVYADNFTKEVFVGRMSGGAENIYCDYKYTFKRVLDVVTLMFEFNATANFMGVINPDTTAKIPINFAPDEAIVGSSFLNVTESESPASFARISPLAVDGSFLGSVRNLTTSSKKYVMQITYTKGENIYSHDTGWTTLNNYVKYRVKNKVVYVVGGSGSGGMSVGNGNYTTVATIPAGLHPAIDIPFTFHTTSGDFNNQSANINTGGNISLFFPTGKSTTYWAFNLSYPIN